MEPPNKKFKKIEIGMEDLDDDVLLEIFNVLNQKELINARKTCMRWQILIDQNPHIYRRMKFDLSDVLMYKFDKYKDVYKDLNYENLYMETPFHPFEIPKALEVFDYYKDSLKSITFHTIPYDFFDSHIHFFKNLEKLVLRRVFNDKPDDRDPTVLNFHILPTLKELHIQMCSLYFLSAPNVEILKLDSHKPTRKLMERFPKVKHLTYDETRDLRNKIKEMEVIPQKLISFRLDKIINKVDLSKFLKSQQESLKVLEFYSENINSVIEYAIYEMNLETLTIKPPLEFNSSNKINTTIKNLSIKGFEKRKKGEKNQQNYFDNLEKIFQSFGSVENLTFNHGYDFFFEMFEIASRTLKNIKSLKILVTINNFNQKLEFNSLETLFISSSSSYDVRESVANLILSCKNVKTLKLFRQVRFMDTRFYFTFEQVKEILMTLKNLEEINANYAFGLTNEIAEFIINGNFKLRRLYLEIYKDDFEVQKELSNKIGRETNIQCVLVVAPKPDYTLEWY